MPPTRVAVVKTDTETPQASNTLSASQNGLSLQLRESYTPCGCQNRLSEPLQIYTENMQVYPHVITMQSLHAVRFWEQESGICLELLERR